MKKTASKMVKIYTLSIPPSSEEPFLKPSRHRRIIQKFKRGIKACHTLNSQGEVDLYLLVPEENFEEYPEKTEEFGLNILKDQRLVLEIFYDDVLFERMTFDLQSQLDEYCLRFIAAHKGVNIYFIQELEGNFVCYGSKGIHLPSVLCYDISRRLAGKKPLILPDFSPGLAGDDFLNSQLLLTKAWGFYIDYTSLLARQENDEAAEEILSLHLLHGLALLQKSRRRAISQERLVLWVGRRINLDERETPKEYYSIYLSGNGLQGMISKDAAAGIFEEALEELAEYKGRKWTLPLAEEAVPLAVLQDHGLNRLKLSDHFYSLSCHLFTEQYKPNSEYQSFYEKIWLLHKEQPQPKIYDLWLKRWEKGYDESGQLSVKEIEKLIEAGREEDLTRIFMCFTHVPSSEVDNLIVKICERYQKKAEPYFISGLQASLPQLKEAAMLGLGILESTKAIPGLIRLAGEEQENQGVWDAFLMIGDPAVPALANLLDQARPPLEEKIRRTLARIGTPAARELLNK